MQDVRLHPPPEPEREPRGRSAGRSAGQPAGQPEAGAIDEHAIRSDPALLAAGWTRRNLAEPARIEELIDLYRALGFEARAVQLTPEDFGPSCVSCASAICRTYVMIYTRRAEPPRQSERED